MASSPKIAKVLALALPLWIFYLIFSGNYTTLDLITGAIAAIIASAILVDIVVEYPTKIVNPVRWGWSIAYAIYYLLVAEVKAHLDVVKRILHPAMPIKPGIVRVPYYVKTDYAKVLIADSITNTPGTVVVDIDEDKRTLYVHWINVKTTTPEECREHISKSFEYFAKRMFD